MPVANILLHTSSHYRKHLYAEGLRRCGYQIANDKNHSPNAGDVLLLWNRSPAADKIARMYEKEGAHVLVTENGYVGKTKAIALGHHLGAGVWNVGKEDRWAQLEIELKPWRKDGDFILLLPQRGIGEPGIAMPRNWEETMKTRLQRVTKRPIRVRKHPGKDRDKGRTLEEDLRGAWCAVTWASGAGIKSIIDGIPVYHDLASWIGATAAKSEIDIENPFLGDRLPMLRRMAWAQWTHREIESGLPFKYLLEK